ncbi:unnamed protein product [Nyctereutes procyonoides]|uniref:(raccoon dog) hypothetical protein n=1 Tax=Nyctereutes procyonoides TaxID=34880 RepID=A0A811YF71_NYCPR|nr:unnamed protein product [Nyctereutes procyonoides]
MWNHSKKFSGSSTIEQGDEENVGSRVYGPRTRGQIRGRPGGAGEAVSLQGRRARGSRCWDSAPSVPLAPATRSWRGRQGTLRLPEEDQIRMQSELRRWPGLCRQRKQPRSGAALGALPVGRESAGGGDARTCPESGRAGGGRWAGSGTVSPMGKRDPASSLAAFPVSEVSAPVRRRQRSPEGERMAVGKLGTRARSGSELPELWRGRGRGRPRPSSLFPPTRRRALGTRAALAPARWSASPEGVVSVRSGADRAAARAGGEGSPGPPAPLPVSALPPAPPSLFSLAPSPGWRDRRGLALDLRGAPRVFNDSLKEAVGKVERDEADVGRVSLLCKSRKGSWEPCGWPQAPAPRRQQVGGGAAAASPIPLPSLARCALAAGAERVRGLAVPPPPCSLTCRLRSALGGPRHGLLGGAPAARPALPPPRTPGSGGQCGGGGRGTAPRALLRDARPPRPPAGPPSLPPGPARHSARG